MKSNKTFLGFKHAFEGIVYALKTQRNLQIHLIVASIVIIFGWYARISRAEWIYLLVAILLVLIAEMVNTSIESMTDLITIKFSRHAKVAKDVAAGLVLLAACGAVIIGVFIFWPYVFK